MKAERWLAWVLRAEGCVMLVATVAIFFPDSWMVAGHRLAGLAGEYPQAPITEYLARSLSMLYASVGFFVFVLSFDLVRYRRLVYFVGLGHLVVTALLVFIDVQAEMPLVWTLPEVLSPALVGVVVLALLSRIPPNEG